jgi:hypothetical protein
MKTNRNQIKILKQICSQIREQEELVEKFETYKIMKQKAFQVEEIIKHLN